MVAAPFRITRRIIIIVLALLVLSLCSVTLLSPPQIEFLSPITSRNRHVDPSYGLIHPPPTNRTPKYAVATFLTHDDKQHWDESDVQNDYSFIGARMLTYQLLYANETKLRTPSISFFILITSSVSAAKRQQLLLDGATLIDVETPSLPQWLRQEDIFQALAADHLSKLRIFSLTQYERILFVNPDTFLTRPIDGIFNEDNLRKPSTTLLMERPDQIKMDEGPLPANYVFAARTDTSWSYLSDPYWHEFPVPKGDFFRMSAILIAPSLELYALLLSTLYSSSMMNIFKDFRKEKWSNRWMRNAGPEHALLNYVFRREGTMPWTELDPRWSTSWGNQKDLAAHVACVGGEFWWSGPIPVRDVWVEWKARMEAEFA